MKTRVFLSFLLSAVLSVNALTAQKKNLTITGYVREADSSAIKGAMIMIDKILSSVTTDEKGFYRIKVKSDAVMITVITGNNRAKSDLINGRTSIDFILGNSSDGQGIINIENPANETVDIGITNVNSRSLSSTINTLDVSGDENSTYQDIYDMIAGRVPGVDVAGKKVRIRGVNSIVSNNDPLFVVNGIPLNSIDHILPQDVESISILKGPSATIYGSRGVNGVIVIKLKSEVSSKKR
ncbi:MAG TPA: TonB-dependent receptor plug domain-containing protein [Bacteroidales bacterium]|jgi:TonB-dependent SusC/RagA subfamily outer membrane receptor|nr:TonB-dependent receptor plug domain-containing protein [Bacteroidales bacterium]NLH79110.1 TonB-dependent receptor plug domain-containing protein [Acidobacteriota bacterium]OQB59346.1 MAG: TonB-dependent Receptor Plug Domain protein [Bacteroidetes bacterium ADurb.Bin145]HOU03655.1 TonB-dependent receptor plug domain-containing protein [Bacteroidales bacterium]HQG63990.1 TonB-dependent receptor plug domain-containing protein [Bacteroidales bacterium]